MTEKEREYDCGFLKFISVCCSPQLTLSLDCTRSPWMLWTSAWSLSFSCVRSCWSCSISRDISSLYSFLLWCWRPLECKAISKTWFCDEQRQRSRLVSTFEHFQKITCKISQIIFCGVKNLTLSLTFCSCLCSTATSCLKESLSCCNTRTSDLRRALWWFTAWRFSSPVLTWSGERKGFGPE